MFAHYIVIAFEETGLSRVIGSNVAIDEVEWPRIFFADTSLYNISTGRIRVRDGAIVTVLRPGGLGYIDPIALATQPPRGAQVTLVSRLCDGNTVIKRPGDGANTTIISPGGKFNVHLDGSHGVQFGSGNVQHGGGTQIGSGSIQTNQF